MAIGRRCGVFGILDFFLRKDCPTLRFELPPLKGLAAEPKIAIASRTVMRHFIIAREIRPLQVAVAEEGLKLAASERRMRRSFGVFALCQPHTLTSAKC